jgi:hypothetical protein
MAKPRGITRKVSPYEWQVFTRLEWAESELQRLDDAAQAFLNAQTVTTSAWSNPDGTEYIIRVDQGIKETPIEIALMIGDVAHHARSALDWLAWGLAIQPNNTTAFPIWTRPRVKNGQPVHPSIAGGATQDVEDILRQIQPYERWKSDPLTSPLYWLREIDNIHKHRHLVTAACSDGGYHRKLIRVSGEIEEETFPNELKPGEPIARFKLSEPNPGLEFDYLPVPYISVTNIAPVLEHENIIGELRYGALLTVRRLIQALAEHLRR